MKSLLIAIVIGFLLNGCVFVVTPAAAGQPAMDSMATASTNPPQGPNAIPSPTDLPVSPNTESGSDEYCRPPYAVLPVSDGNDISEDEIVFELMRIWLRRYVSPEAPPSCRIDGFSIDQVYFDMDILSRPLEPRGDFMRLVEFSVKPIQTPNDWMSFSGELDSQNWLRLSHAVAVLETTDGYTMQFAYP